MIDTLSIAKKHNTTNNRIHANWIAPFTSPNESDILVFILSIGDELGGVDSDTVSVVVQSVTTSIDEKIIPQKIKLLGNHPNPFNPKTDIVFQILKETNIVISIYNVYGQRVWIKNLGLKEKGVCRVSWFGENTNGDPVVSGVYFYHIVAGNKQLISKMSLLK